MTYEHIVDIVRQTLWVTVQIAAPLLLLAMVVGLLISILQSVTQINDMTLTFVPKILVFALAFAVMFPWFLKILTKYTNEILIHHWDKVVSLASYAY